MTYKNRLSQSVLICVIASAAFAQTGPKSLPAISSQADFDKISVTYDANTPYALPHLMFVIDRKDKNKIYYVNKKRYSFHKDFVNGTYLSLERGKEFFVNNYIKPNRRFILGTLAYQIPIKRWTFEFWEGDLIPADQIQLAYDVINKSFFAPVAFKPNSLRQDEATRSLAGMQRVLQERHRQRAVVPGAQRRERARAHSHHSEARRPRRNRFQRDSRARRSAGPASASCRHHYVATFDAAVAHQPAGKRLGNSERVHQKRAGAVEAV